jgi:hypothetical protein
MSAYIKLTSAEVTLGFCISAMFTLVGSIALYSPHCQMYHPILEEIVLRFADQQLLFTMFVAAIAFSKHASISLYHVEAVGELSWYGGTTVLAAMASSRRYFFGVHFIHLLFRCVSLVILFGFVAIFILWIAFLGPGINGISEDYGRNGSPGCPAKCAWEQPYPVWKSVSLPGLTFQDKFYILLAFAEVFIFLSCLGVTACVWKRRRAMEKLSFPFLLFLLVGWVCATTILFYDHYVIEKEGPEDYWTFGQILGLMVGISPALGEICHVSSQNMTIIPTLSSISIGESELRRLKGDCSSRAV